MPAQPNRRQLLAAGAAAPLMATATLADPLTPVPAPRLLPNSIPIADLPSHFDVESEIHNL